MTIRGTDHVFPGDVKNVALLCLCTAWPDAVVEDCGVEVFVFRDAVAQAAWDRQGATETTDGWMVHILVGPNTTTIVTGAKDQRKIRRPYELHDMLDALSVTPEHMRTLLAALDGSRDIPKAHAGGIASARQWLNRYDCGELPTLHSTGAVVIEEP